MRLSLKLTLIAIGLLCALAVMIFVPYLLCKHVIFPWSKLDDDINNYLNSGRQIDEYAREVFPDIDSLPEYEDLTYQYYKDGGYWVSETMLLVVKYNDDTYKDEKQKLSDKYVFLDKDLSYYIPECEFSLNTYEFRVIRNPEGSGKMYPKNFGMVATSDEENSIAYLYYYNIELDLLCSPGEENPMQNFVEEYFKHEW